jgi:2',3'-cyclic-nucleotide 2'-phosphodiesterase (5'-nucleotidase family)
MLLNYRKSQLFLSFCFGLIILASCSRQTNVYHVQQIKGWPYEINKELGVDSNMIRLIRPYYDSLEKTMSEVISYSDKRMSKGFPEGLLGNFLTDLVFNYSKKTLNLNADFCMQNNGGFRADIPEGPVTVKNIYEIMPFDNELVILEMDPKAMKAFLNYISKGEAVSVSGIRIIIHKNRYNEGFIGDMPLDTNKTYLMATSDYLANGGSNMLFLRNCRRAYESKIRIRDIEIAALREKYALKQNLNSKQDGRIQIVE